MYIIRSLIKIINDDQQRRFKQHQSIKTKKEQVRTLTATLRNLKSESNLRNKTDFGKAKRIYVTEIKPYKYGTWDINPENNHCFGNHDWD
ncbi:hypothetical protein AYI70_g1439 [Smittium culicis]|uniref:Uncharacterized protein n=1 Tax=Smittium culicis TaxID=133412 RepID=A0A1R1YCR1_9FUNG|nr:hypothetical protein AYI70_g1439 [Smittium culicis]